MEFEGVEFGRFRKKEDVSEAELLTASERLNAEYMSMHDGILCRRLVALDDGWYMDMVLGRDRETVERVCAGWMGTKVCEDFLALIEHDSADIRFGRTL